MDVQSQPQYDEEQKYQENVYVEDVVSISESLTERGGSDLGSGFGTSGIESPEIILRQRSYYESFAGIVAVLTPMFFRPFVNIKDDELSSINSNDSVLIAGFVIIILYFMGHKKVLRHSAILGAILQLTSLFVISYCSQKLYKTFSFLLRLGTCLLFFPLVLEAEIHAKITALKKYLYFVIPITLSIITIISVVYKNKTETYHVLVRRVWCFVDLFLLLTAVPSYLEGMSNFFSK